MKRIAAALTLFTRLPAWRWCDIPVAYYDTAVVFWPLTGWITGGLTAVCIYLLSMLMPMLPAVVAAMILKLLLTGCLHEDGLADFCDGFGGGHDKEGILRIMKDSHIGTYGVIGLVMYFLMMAALLSSMSPLLAALTVFAADPFCKFCASQLTNTLPYARPEGAKNKISYRKMVTLQFTVNMVSGILPVVPLAIFSPWLTPGCILPLIALASLIFMMKRRIGGYTGDCCGATFLICELTMCTGIVIMSNI